MKHALLVVLVGLVLACGAIDPLRLSTGTAPDPLFCSYLSYGQGEFVEDAVHGTAVKNENGTYALIWPVGFTARRSGEGIEVVNTIGEVIAVTGHKYRFIGASWGSPPGPIWTGGPGCVNEIE